MTDTSFVNTHGTATFRVLKRGPGNTVPQLVPAELEIAVFPIPDSTVPANTPAVPIVQYGGFKTWKPLVVDALIVASGGLDALALLRDPSDAGTITNYPGATGSGTRTLTGMRLMQVRGKPITHIGESTETTDGVEIEWIHSP